MKVIIFGASGKIGSLLTTEMLARGHKVDAFIYGSNPFSTQKGFRVIHGDVHNKKEVFDAIKGHDAVVSTLGSWGTPTKDILSAAMTHIIPAMEQHKIARIVSLTGADARDIGDTPGLLQKLSHVVFGIVARDIMEDGETHIRLLRNSRLTWTVLRSPVMRNSGKAGSYRLGLRLPMPWDSIHRKDVVNALAHLAETNDYAGLSPVITER